MKINMQQKLQLTTSTVASESLQEQAASKHFAGYLKRKLFFSKWSSWSPGNI